MDDMTSYEAWLQVRMMNLNRELKQVEERRIDLINELNIFDDELNRYRSRPSQKVKK